MPNFEVNPSSVLTGESVAALTFAAIIFIVVPIFLAIVEYRITKKEKKNGLYLMLGTFASALLLGVYSLFVGLLLLVIFLAVSSLHKRKSQKNENGLQTHLLQGR